jgi:RHS repeat-associated protein
LKKGAGDIVSVQTDVDHLGMPTRVSLPDGRTISFTRDEVGNMTKIVDSVLGAIAYQYDLMDRLSTVTYPGANVVSYGYDAAGNLQRVTYPDGRVVHYTYNANGWLTEVIAGTGTTRFEYDKVGRFTREHLPNGIIVCHGYDAAGSLTSLIAKDAKGTLLSCLSYAFDAVGNCLRNERKSRDGGERTAYKYDSLYRLVRVKRSDGSEAKYKYDDKGNRLSRQTSSPGNRNSVLRYATAAIRMLGISWIRTSYTYDIENHLTRAGDIEFTYDKKGNVSEKRVGDEVTHYFYDGDNRLIKVEYPDRTYNEFHYDALGRRVRKRHRNGRTVQYIYDGHNLIQELDDRGQLIASYTYGLGIDRPISMTRTRKTYYYVYDHLGSVIYLTDEGGEVVAGYEYDEWGNIAQETGGVINPFRFAGREWEDDSRLYYYRARYYDPGVGRFITPDPVAAALLDCPGYSAYSYVNNNPQSYTDPFGLMPWVWGQANWLWQVWQRPSQLFNAAYAKQWYGQMASQTLNTPGNVFVRGVQATAWDVIGGYIPGEAATQGQALGQMAWGLVPGVDAARSFGGVFINIAEGSNVGAALNALSLCGTHFAMKADFFARAADQAANLQQGAQAMGLFGYARAFSDISFARNLSAIDHALASYALSVPGRLRSVSSLAKWLGGNVPDVGGVLFAEAAEVLTDIEELSGAYWDDRLGHLVLVGKGNGKKEERYLPIADKDHLAVAMRAVFTGDNLGVSIDPPAGYLESSKFPPDGTRMLVRYLGCTENTLFGAIMFKADKLLKNLSMGVDNETREEVTSGVRDFENELNLSLKCRAERKSAWHRMWFLIDDMKLQVPVGESSDRNCLCFAKATLKVRAEYVSRENDPGVDPVAERFATHFTAHYDDLVKEYPVLDRLRELAKIVAVAKWLKNSGKHVDLSFLSDYQFMDVPTPEDTPGTTVSTSTSSRDGATTYTRTYSLYGGVDFNFAYQAAIDDERAIALRKVSQESKPCQTALVWGFSFEGEPRTAVSIPIARTNGNYVAFHTDFSSPPSDEPRAEIVRRFDSFSTRRSIFGFGWTLKIPYELFVLNPRKPDSPIVLIDNVTGNESKYVFVRDEQGYYLVKDEKEEEGRVRFSCDPMNCIRKNPQGIFTWSLKDGIAYDFDPQGRLVSAVYDSRRLDYIYEKDRLICISDSLGHEIRFIYGDGGRVQQIVVCGQATVNYSYDRNGDLVEVTDDRGTAKRYTYDAHHRLIKSTDVRAGTVSRNSYDPLGRIVKKGQDVVLDDVGNAIHRSYDSDGRLVLEKDKAGNCIRYEYDQTGNLKRSVTVDVKMRETVFEYDTQERVTGIINPEGHRVRLTCDSRANITSITDPNGHTRYFEYDNENNPIISRDAMGNEWKRRYDHLSRLRSLADPMGNKVELAYDPNGRIDSIGTPQGTTRYQYDGEGRLTRLIDANGRAVEYSYDSKSDLIGIARI